MYNMREKHQATRGPNRSLKKSSSIRARSLPGSRHCGAWQLVVGWMAWGHLARANILREAKGRVRSTFDSTAQGTNAMGVPRAVTARCKDGPFKL